MFLERCYVLIQSTTKVVINFESNFPTRIYYLIGLNIFHQKNAFGDEGQ